MLRANPRSDGARRRGRPRGEPGSVPTRERLLRATERLVALHGVDGVTTRQICNEAETELGSLHHHFGSKDQLILAVREWRVDLINQIAQELAGQKRSSTPKLDIRDLAEILVVPFVRVSEGEAHNYVAYTVAVYHCRRLVERIAVDTPWTATMLELYGEIRPRLDPDERRRRLALFVLMVTGAIAGDGLSAWLDAAAPNAADKLVATLIDCVAAGLDAPAASTD